MQEHLRTAIVAAVTALLVATLVVPALEERGRLPERPREVREGQMLEKDAPTVVRREVYEEESEIIDAIAAAEDAVVSVIVSKDLPVIERYYEEGGGSPFPGFDFFFDDPFFSPFEFRVPRYRERGTEKREVGGGTAFFVSKDGLLMTNKHVVADPEAEYTVLLNDGRKLPATVAARDPGNDIAILKTEGSDFPSLAFDSSELSLGQTVIAIGNALGEFRNTVSVGVISGLKRSLIAGSGFGGPVEHLESIIQTDAAINQGNSGGPLLNAHGKVIGMNTAVAAGAQNIGFAIPSADLLRALESFQEHGKILRALLGVRFIPVTKELQEKNKLLYDYGALITRGEDPSELAVLPGSPADKAGLEEGDIILEADGEKLTLERSLAAIIRRKVPGEKVSLKIFHEGEERAITVELGEEGEKK